jgi:hypothetical protein
LLSILVLSSCNYDGSDFGRFEAGFGNSRNANADSSISSQYDQSRSIGNRGNGSLAEGLCEFIFGVLPAILLPILMIYLFIKFPYLFFGYYFLKWAFRKWH